MRKSDGDDDDEEEDYCAAFFFLYIRTIQRLEFQDLSLTSGCCLKKPQFLVPVFELSVAGRC